MSDLRSELLVKERELTDIRLEALNSAHQLEQLREAMNNMQVCLSPLCMSSKGYVRIILHLCGDVTQVFTGSCSQSTVENLKAENSHLKTGSQLNLPCSGPTSSTSQPSGLASLLGPSLRQPMSMSLTKSFSLSLNDCKDPGKRRTEPSPYLTWMKTSYVLFTHRFLLSFRSFLS